MDDKNGWRHLRRIKFNKKHLSRRMRKVEGVTVRHAHKFIVSRWDNIREVRRHIITWLIGIALLIVVVGAQIVWFQRDYTLSAPIPGGVYAEAVNGPVETLNPLYATTSAEVASSKLLFSSLFDYDSTGHLRGDLATSIKPDPNGLDYTVTLRSDAKWHNGKPVTVQDVIFTVGLMKDPGVRAVSSLRQAWRDVTITPLGESAVKFTLPNPNAAFPHALTFSILPQNVLKDIEPHLMRESSFSTAPVGSGPFQIKRLQLVSQAEERKIVHMSAFPDYYRGEPKLNRFQLHVYRSDKSVLSALRTNEVNAVADIDSLSLSQIDMSHYRVIPKPVNSGIYALFNTTGPMLKDMAVRQALQAATNTPALRKKLGGEKRSMDLPFADDQLLGSDIPKAPPYDLTKAGTLLDQAGWTVSNGKRMKAGQQLKLRMITVTEDAYEPTVKELADQWRQVGVDAEILVIDPTDPTQDFTQILKDRDYDVLINRLNIGGDPDVYAYWHSSQATPLGKNYSNYSNSISDTALSSALTKSDPVERDTRYKAFARQWLADAPAIGLYEANMYYVQSKNINTVLDDEKIISPIDRYGGVIHWTVERSNVYKTP